MYPYRRLAVWQKAHALAIAVRAAFHGGSAPDIASQIRRASASVPTNIVEGAGSQTNGLFSRFLGIALASAQETEYLLLLAHDTGHLAAPDHERLSAQCTEVQRMLSGLLAAVRRGTTVGGEAARVGKPRTQRPRTDH